MFTRCWHAGVPLWQNIKGILFPQYDNRLSLNLDNVENRRENVISPSPLLDSCTSALPEFRTGKLPVFYEREVTKETRTTYPLKIYPFSNSIDTEGKFIRMLDDEQKEVLAVIASSMCNNKLYKGSSELCSGLSLVVAIGGVLYAPSDIMMSLVRIGMISHGLDMILQPWVCSMGAGFVAEKMALRDARQICGHAAVESFMQAVKSYQLGKSEAVVQ